MARKLHGYTSRDELLTARERALSEYGSAVACGTAKRATKIRRYARTLGVAVRSLDHARSTAARRGCKRR
jgi:hypothetical protein